MKLACRSSHFVYFELKLRVSEHSAQQCSICNVVRRHRNQWSGPKGSKIVRNHELVEAPTPSYHLLPHRITFQHILSLLTVFYHAPPHRTFQHFLLFFTLSTISAPTNTVHQHALSTTLTSFHQLISPVKHSLTITCLHYDLYVSLSPSCTPNRRQQF